MEDGCARWDEQGTSGRPPGHVGLLTARRVPLEVHLFEGNKGEITTLIPVLTPLLNGTECPTWWWSPTRDAVRGKPARLEHAGFGFIVGSKTTSAATDLADHLRRAETRSPTPRSSKTPAAWAPARTPGERRVVYQYSFKRSQHDRRAINKMIERAEAVAAGTRTSKKDRFVTISGATKGVDWALVERARYVIGAEGLCHQPRA